jgi:N-acyl-D-aspartate/D-glutamate deacylase
MDPETGLDAVRDVGIRGGVIAAIREGRLDGREVLDARGLVVAPGFIDLHSHAQTAEAYALKAQDGVTAALELEVGVGDVDGWYAEREGRAQVHFGASIGHIPVRMAVMGDPPGFLPDVQKSGAATKEATDAQIAEIAGRLREGLRRGAVAVGFGIQYTPAASRWEILEAFRVAAEFGASCHVHMRHNGAREPNSSTQALEEVIAAAAVTGAPLHVVHIHSTSARITPRNLGIIAEARARGMDVTTECYPYTAGMTDLASGVFAEGWREAMEIDYKDLMWVATGERLTAESFERYRKTGGWVAIFSIPPAAVEAALRAPFAIVASDGLLQAGKGHPRNAGTYARVLGHYVREQKVLTLMEALRKISLMPAQRLERHVPMMKQKGRVQVGADADLAVFDPDRVIDRATYEQPTRPSEGFRFVLVGGEPVVKDGALVTGLLPGRAVRAPVR